MTVEDGCLEGGFGSAVLEHLQQRHAADTTKPLPTVVRLGVPDAFVQHGPVARLQHDCGYDTDAIESCLLDIYNKM